MEKNGSVEDENRKIRRLKMMVNLGLAVLRQERLSRKKAEEMVESIRRSALRMFPGKETTWEIVYAPRFRRTIEDRWGKGKARES
ncbi:MAG: hypothetical protein E3J63_03275 [Elusimicrobia bacterium]|nr:MAG: hypothetical protein E3J63_03275 [Elusimicrobiota bacterium]